MAIRFVDEEKEAAPVASVEKGKIRFVDEGEQKRAWYDIPGKISDTWKGVGGALDQENKVTAEGRQPAALGTFLKGAEVAGGVGNTLGDVLAPAFDNPATHQLGKIAAKTVEAMPSKKEKVEWSGKVANTPEQDKLEAVEKQFEEHPELGNRLNAVGGLLSFLGLKNPLKGVAKEGAEKAFPAAAKASRTVTDLTGNAFESVSDVPKESLAAYGWGKNETAKGIAQYANKQGEIADKVLNRLDNIEQHLPERKEINEALQKMPSVNVSKTIEALESVKNDPAWPVDVKGNKAIDEMVKTLTEFSGPSGNVPASKFRAARMRLDNQIAASFNKDERSMIEEAGVRARTQMMNDLKDAAEKSGNQKYIDLMNSYSDKLQKIDELKGYIGNNPEARKRHIDSFIDNVFNRNRGRAQDALENFGDVVGEDLLQQSKYAAMAKQFGGRASPPLISPVKTGTRSVAMGGLIGAGYGAAHGNIPMVLGGLGTFGAASPAVAARILGPMEKATSALEGKVAKKAAEKAKVKELLSLGDLPKKAQVTPITDERRLLPAPMIETNEAKQQIQPILPTLRQRLESIGLGDLQFPYKTQEIISDAVKKKDWAAARQAIQDAIDREMSKGVPIMPTPIERLPVYRR